MNNTRKCTKCQKDRLFTDFWKNKLTGRENQCKFCRNKSRKAPHRIRSSKNAKLKLNYGITYQAKEQISNIQNGACAICKNPETAVDYRTNNIKELSVDHCHKTGRIRGLLCSNCNRAIGLLKDDIALLIAAIKYLK